MVVLKYETSSLAWREFETALFAHERKFPLIKGHTRFITGYTYDKNCMRMA